MAALPLVADCVSCGGAVPLALAGPAPRCRYCGAGEPLESAVAAKLATMRARFERRGARRTHLTARLASAATGLQGMAIALGLTMWGMFGGMAVGLALDHEVPLREFIAGETMEGWLTLEWWVLWSVAAGLPLSVLAFGACLAWLRSLALASLPLEPAFAGGQPRCSACAAELPAGTAIRRCRHCDSDNLISGARYQASARELDRALDELAGRFERDLGRRITLADKVLLFATMLPLALLLVAPIVGVFTPAIPALWWIVPGLWLAAIASVAWAGLRRIASVEALECLTFGSAVLVGSAPMRVEAQLVVPANEGGQTRVVSFLASQGQAASLAYHLDASGRRWQVSVWSVDAGGEPLDEGSRAALVSAELRRPGGDAVKVEALQLLDHGGSLRVWPGPSEPGTTPRWTLRMNQDPPVVISDDA